VPAWLQSIVDFFGRFRLWYVVMPWERAVRVRLGNRVVKRGPGFHWKLPLLDRVFIQNVRLHVVSTCSQVLEDGDGRTVAVVACIGFSIDDILRVYTSVQHLDEALYSWASAALADHITKGRAAAEEAVARSLEEQATRWGIRIEFFRLTDYTRVRAFRLLQGDRWSRSEIDLGKGL